MLRYLIMYLYKKKNGKKFDLKIARYRGLPYSGWTYQSETTLISCLNSPLRISRTPISPFTAEDCLARFLIRKGTDPALRSILPSKEKKAKKERRRRKSIGPSRFNARSMTELGLLRILCPTCRSSCRVFVDEFIDSRSH